MLPAQRGDMGEQGIGDVDAALAQVAGGAVEINGVPQDDGRDDEVKTGCPVPLVLKDAVAQFAEPIEEDGAGECVAGLAFVEVGIGAAMQICVIEPVEHEQGAFDPPDLAQGAGDRILAWIASELAQHHRCANGELRGSNWAVS